MLRIRIRKLSVLDPDPAHNYNEFFWGQFKSLFPKNSERFSNEMLNNFVIFQFSPVNSAEVNNIVSCNT